MDRLVSFALQQRLLIILACVGLLFFGIRALQQVPIDAFPDVTNVQVQILAEASGMAPVEVEQLVTYPVEVSMGGLPGMTEVRSLSKLRRLRPGQALPEGPVVRSAKSFAGVR